jgi:hypothetical protein
MVEVIVHSLARRLLARLVCRRVGTANLFGQFSVLPSLTEEVSKARFSREDRLYVEQGLNAR